VVQVLQNDDNNPGDGSINPNMIGPNSAAKQAGANAHGSSGLCREVNY
jgi:hypothetical protein